jgi:predicted GH43/DUF377 family glycosyl hydrolase
MRRKYNILLRPEDIECHYASDEWECVGVFNPGGYWDGNRWQILARATFERKNQTGRYVHCPRWDGKGIVEDVFSLGDEAYVTDKRCAHITNNLNREHRRDPNITGGMARLTNFSYIIGATSANGEQIDTIGTKPIIPLTEKSMFGIEDPRMVGDPRDGHDGAIVTVVEVSESGIVTAIMETENFKTYNRIGATHPDNKDVMALPVKIDDLYAFQFRPFIPSGLVPGGSYMGFAGSPDLIHIGECTKTATRRSGRFDFGSVGWGTPFIKLDDDSMFSIYHGTGARMRGRSLVEGVPSYKGGGILIDPKRLFEGEDAIIGRSKSPLLTWNTRECAPEHRIDTESRFGSFLSDIVFPTAIRMCDGGTQVLCGIDDTFVASTYLTNREIYESMGLQNTHH